MSERKRTKWQQVAITVSRQSQATGLTQIELEKLREELEGWLIALQEFSAEAPPLPGMWQPPMDLCETETEIVVTVELAGVREEQIEVCVSPKTLQISGEKKRQRRRNDVSYLCGERTYGKFQRIIALRWTIETESVSAELQDGILVVRLPKMTERRGGEIKIPIKSIVE